MNLDSPLAFLEVFRPPSGYKFEWMVGSTFTLDLTCLVQLALTTHGYKKSADMISPHDALAVFSDFSRRSSIFFQQTRIKDLAMHEAYMSKRMGQLLSLLDPALESVSVPRSGVCFHPKVWLIHFIRIDKGSSPITKLCVLSRNLTQDLSWDVGFISESCPGNGEPEIAAFLKKLMDSTPANNKTARSRLTTAIEILKKISFKLPEKVKNQEFSFQWPGAKQFDKELFRGFDELIIISPFLADGAIKNLANDDAKVTLITSSKDSERAIKMKQQSKLPFDLTCYLMSHEHSELHAKIYVGRKGDGVTHFILGSANATINGLGVFENQSSTKKNMEAVIHCTYPANFYDQFMANFVTDKKWLLELTAQSKAPQVDQDDAIQEVFDQFRNHISTGIFELNSKRRSKFELRFNCPKDFALPKGVKAHVEILNAGFSTPLSEIINKGVITLISHRDFSRLLRITLKANGVEISFLTTAQTNFDFGLRRKAAITELVQTEEDFVKLLNSMLGIHDYEIKRPKKPNDAKPAAKNNTTQNYTLSWRHIETLLLNLRNEDSILLIDDSFQALSKGQEKPSKEFQALKKVWSDIKQAWRDVYGAAS